MPNYAVLACLAVRAVIDKTVFNIFALNLKFSFHGHQLKKYHKYQLNVGYK